MKTSRRAFTFIELLVAITVPLLPLAGASVVDNTKPPAAKDRLLGKWTCPAEGLSEEWDFHADGTVTSTSLGGIHDAYVLGCWLREQANAADRRGKEAEARDTRREAGRFLRLSHDQHRELRGRRPEVTVERLTWPVTAAVTKEERDGARDHPSRDRGGARHAGNDRRRATPHS